MLPTVWMKRQKDMQICVNIHGSVAMVFVELSKQVRSGRLNKG